MEFFIVIVVIFISFHFLIKLFSSQETNLYRRIWSAEKYKNYDAQFKALEKLDDIFSIKIKTNINSNEKNVLEKNIINLMNSAVEFDVSHPNNLGIKVVPIVAQHLLMSLQFFNLNDFNKYLNEIQMLDYAELGKAINMTLSQMKEEKN